MDNEKVEQARARAFFGIPERGDAEIIAEAEHQEAAAAKRAAEEAAEQARQNRMLAEAVRIAEGEGKARHLSRAIYRANTQAENRNRSGELPPGWKSVPVW